LPTGGSYGFVSTPLVGSVYQRWYVVYAPAPLTCGFWTCVWLHFLRTGNLLHLVGSFAVTLLVSLFFTATTPLAIQFTCVPVRTSWTRLLFYHFPPLPPILYRYFCTRCRCARLWLRCSLPHYSWFLPADGPGWVPHHHWPDGCIACVLLQRLVLHMHCGTLVCTCTPPLVAHPFWFATWCCCLHRCADDSVAVCCWLRGGLRSHAGGFGSSINISDAQNTIALLPTYYGDPAGRYAPPFVITRVCVLRTTCVTFGRFCGTFSVRRLAHCLPRWFGVTVPAVLALVS